MIVAGPTGSGKSSLALAMARTLGGEIVNCDSMQLYRGFDIGTAKPSAADRSSVPHHLFDVLDPGQSYSAGEYARLARACIREISARNRLPIVVGGTGFYLRATLHGLPPLPERDPELRARLSERETKRPGSLHRILKRLEPFAAARIHPNDTQKLIRALEVRLLTRRALPALHAAEPLEGFTILKIGLNPDRVQLHKRLDKRVEHMFASGLLDEVRALLAAGLTGDEKPFESLGYKQALAHLRGKMSLTEAIASTKLETRQYAKRQMTWFRREPDVSWLGGFGDSDDVQHQAMRMVERAGLAARPAPGPRKLH